MPPDLRLRNHAAPRAEQITRENMPGSDGRDAEERRLIECRVYSEKVKDR